MKRVGRRSLVSARDIAKGTVVTKEMIAVKRPGSGLHPELTDSLIGSVAQRDIEYDDPLTWDMFIKYEA